MKSKTSLKSLSINGLRGVANPLNIVFDKPFTLIFGHNGTGKTSICDAIDFLANGDCGSLGDNSVGASKYKFWPFIGKKSTDVAVDLSLTDGSSWRATISSSKPTVTTTSPHRELPVVKIWRRKQMMDLILAKPLERFKVIAEFINVGEIDISEKGVRDLQRNIDRQLQDAASKIAENYSTLSDQCRIAGGDDTKVLEWAKTEASKSTTEFDDEIKVYANLSKAIELFVSSVRVLSDLNSPGTALKKSLDEAEEEYNKAKSSVVEGASDTLALLSDAKKYFDNQGVVDACPLCDSAENIIGLPERVSGVLDSYSELNSTEQNFQTSKQKFDAHTERKSEQNGIKTKYLADLITCLEVFQYEHQQVEELKDILSTPDSVDKNKLKEILTALEQYKDSLIRSKGLRDTIEAAYDQYESNMESQKNNNILKPKIDRLLEIHETKRKIFIDDILASIADEVGRLYEIIHPSEGLDKISLQLDSKKRSSLDIQSKFLNKDGPPGAYFSNSHLDTLGLCILLALVKREKPENTVLIMDDVLGSIDEPHVERIIGLIYEESKNFMHTLVTTHFDKWHTKIMTGQLRNSSCQLIELESWNPKLGVIVRGSARDQVERLRDNIVNRPNEPEQVAQQAGFLLEMVCNWLVSRYELSIPQRKNTANDYLNALKEKYSKQLKVEELQSDGSYVVKELRQLIADLRTLFQIRNIVGAHFNELASHLTANDSLEFGKKVLELSDLLICKKEGFPNKEKLTYLATPSETRRLYPLRMNR
jgi:hypothetical protein